MVRFLLHSLFLVAAVILAFFWTNSPTLSIYTLQLIALFILLFFLNQFIFRRQHQKAPRTGKLSLTLDAVVFTMVVMLLVTSTGGLTSPLFFLLYFLMFGLSLLFEPLIAFSLTAAMAIFFLATPTKEAFLTESLQLFSLILITPLALFFGNQYLKALEDEEKIKILKEENLISENQIQKEETDVLLWSSLELKRTLVEILDEISLLLSDISHLTVTQKERLLKIHQKLVDLLRSGEKLEEEVDKTTDET